MDLYLVLGVSPGASEREVKRAYTRLARRYHPHLNPGDPEAEAFFRQVTEAYETLSDPSRRQAYDADGTPPGSSASGSVEFRGFDFSAPLDGASATFGELFSDVAADDGSTAAPGDKGSDLFGEVPLSFEQALKGTERQLSVTRLDTCERCGGTGLRRAAETRCAQCQGGGVTRWQRGHMIFAKPCGACGGTGRQRRRPCTSCQAEGRVAQTEHITVKIPAGIAPDGRMRVPGKGNVGRRGGPPGDLYITAKIAAHPLFERQGEDLHLEVPVAVHEAMLGAEIEVPTIDGVTTLTIPPGTQPGQRLRLPSQGVPSPRTGERGALVVTVKLVLPPLKDERSKALMRELGTVSGGDVRRGLFGR